MYLLGTHDYENTLNLLLVVCGKYSIVVDDLPQLDFKLLLTQLPEILNPAAVLNQGP